MLLIQNLKAINPTFAKDLVPKQKGIWFLIDNSSHNIIYIGIAIELMSCIIGQYDNILI